MFATFFYLLRARGLAVSLDEWLTLVNALDKGLAGASFNGFYQLCRAILIKSESDYDKLDCAFLEFFKDAAFTEEVFEDFLLQLNNPSNVKEGNKSDGALLRFFKDFPFASGISKEMLWRLNNPSKAKEEGKDFLGRDYDHLYLSNKDIEERFAKQLKEQDGEANGGTRAVGTGGASPFGNNGESATGIRIGGSSKNRRAFRVAGERRFRDFREDNVLGLRHFQMAFRKLCQFSSRVDAPKDELYINETIHETGNNAGRLKLVFDKPRKNTVKLLLLMDSGGSMDYYSHLCALLFQAVSKSNHFKDLKIYYFHNIIKGNLFTTPETHPLETISLDWMLRNLSNDYKVIIVGDARMNPGELEENTFCAKQGKLSGLGWFRALRDHFPHTVWLNPQEQSGGGRAFWNQTYYDIQKEVDMYPLTVESLGVAIKKLLAAR